MFMVQESCRSAHVCAFSLLKLWADLSHSDRMCIVVSCFLLPLLRLLDILHIYGLEANVITIDLVLIVAVNSSKVI